MTDGREFDEPVVALIPLLGCLTAMVLVYQGFPDLMRTPLGVMAAGRWYAQETLAEMIERERITLGTRNRGEEAL
jgi:hypothetical protein